MPDERDESPRDEDIERFDHSFVVCKVCGFEYYDELDACPKCHREDGIDAEGFPWWIVIAASLAAGGLILVFVL
ncbi:MAG: hypothetical protein IT439_01980 [Phycisphaerales bacterium]|nr:hypothetical protein [Phycisphaerales bacterium]